MGISLDKFLLRPMKYIHKSAIPSFIVEKMKKNSSSHPSVLGSGCNIELYHIDY